MTDRRVGRRRVLAGASLVELALHGHHGLPHQLLLIGAIASEGDCLNDQVGEPDHQSDTREQRGADQVAQESDLESLVVPEGPATLDHGGDQQTGPPGNSEGDGERPNRALQARAAIFHLRFEVFELDQVGVVVLRILSMHDDTFSCALGTEYLGGVVRPLF